jgi:hypothetical protein
MKVEAEQFVFPFDAPGQREFEFIPSASIFDGFGVLHWFSWWVILSLHCLPSKVIKHDPFVDAVPAVFQSRKRSAFCVLGVLSFPSAKLKSKIAVK